MHHVSRNALIALSLVLALLGTAVAEPEAAEKPVRGQLGQLADFISAREVTITDGPEGRDYILRVRRQQPANTEWLTAMRRVLSDDDTPGIVSIFAINEDGDILAAARRTASGIVTTGQAAIAPRSEMPGIGRLVPLQHAPVTASPLPLTPRSDRHPAPAHQGASDTWGAECTSYQHGDTWGVRCRSW